MSFSYVPELVLYIIFVQVKNLCQVDKDVKTQKGNSMKKLLISAAVCVAVSTAAVFSLKKRL